MVAPTKREDASRPYTRRDSSAYHLIISAATCTSCRDSARVLPCSRVSQMAMVSSRSSMRATPRSKISARSRAGRWRQAAKPSSDAAKASAKSSVLAEEKSPNGSSVAGLQTAMRNAPRPERHRPLIRSSGVRYSGTDPATKGGRVKGVDCMGSNSFFRKMRCARPTPSSTPGPPRSPQRSTGECLARSIS